MLCDKLNLQKTKAFADQKVPKTKTTCCPAMQRKRTDLHIQRKERHCTVNTSFHTHMTKWHHDLSFSRGMVALKTAYNVASFREPQAARPAFDPGRGGSPESGRGSSATATCGNLKFRCNAKN